VNYIKELLKIAQNPCPLDPPGADDWKRLEVLLPMPLPSDYKKMIENFGRGWFGSFFEFLNPEQSAIEDIIEDHKSVQAGMRNPVVFFPEKRGLLIVGTMDRHFILLKPSNGVWVLEYYHHSSQIFRSLPYSVPEFWYKLYAKQLGPDWEGLRQSIWESEDDAPFFSPRE
jgi:hypothetical protein